MFRNIMDIFFFFFVLKNISIIKRTTVQRKYFILKMFPLSTL